MKLGIDYDGTWTEAPELWSEIVQMFQDEGHECVVVTRRSDPGTAEYPAQEVRDAIGDQCEIVFCGQRRKDKCVDGIDIWIDDNPGLIVMDKMPKEESGFRTKEEFIEYLTDFRKITDALVESGDLIRFEAPGLYERDDAAAHEYASTMVEPDEALADRIRDWAAETISEDDLSEQHGLEDEIHITALYGLYDDDPGPIYGTAKKVEPFTVTLGKLDSFETDKYDVLFISVDSPGLVELHDALAELEHTDTHPKYTPHLTLAYLQPGAAATYISEYGDEFVGEEFDVDEVIFSDTMGERTVARLKMQESIMIRTNIPENETRQVLRAWYQESIGEQQERCRNFTPIADQLIEQELRLMEKKWSADVTKKEKWHPPEGFFTGSADSIASGLKSASSSLKQAMSRLNFYINRQGSNLSATDKKKLDSVKNKLRKLYGE